MIAADAFLKPALEAGFNFYTGVPCSFLTPIIDRVISGEAYRYVAAGNEGEAVAIASGAWLAGRGTVVMCQNSGLGNAINPLTSLNYPFRIPALLIVTWRGAPNLKDEPQHELMGAITPELLDSLRVPHARFPTAEADVADTLAEATAEMDRSGLPYAFIMEKDSVKGDGLDAAQPVRGPEGVRVDLSNGASPPARIEALERIVALLPDAAAIIATTGKTGRELFTIADRDQHLYQVGSMGCASAMGLGVALNVARPVVVLDGDGAALMHMGIFATIGAYAPSNLIHVVLDNGTYDSTGGQATVSSVVDFAGAAAACGYPRSAVCDSLAGLEKAMKNSLTTPGPHLIHLRIAPGSTPNLGRPNVKPHEVAIRFKDFLADGPSR